MSDRHEWFTSSYSDSQGGACLEVAHTGPQDTVHVRDSKLPAPGPELTVPADAWTAFVAYAAGNG
jgi:hypothetical protein